LPRLLVERVSARLGQPVIVENRAGAGGNIGAEAVFKADPDGYTLLAAPPPPLAVNASLYPKLAYDPTQFTPVTIMGSVPNVLLVNAKVVANSVEELIAFAKANPDKLSYASQGNGSTSHLTAEMFRARTGAAIVHVAYKGSAPALTDLISGQVDLMFDNLGVSLAHVRSGKLKALAVASPQRVAGLPNVPTMSDTIPAFISTAWFGVVGPPKMSAAIAEQLSAAFADALRQPDLAKRLADLSCEPIGNTPAQAAAFIRDETVRWREVIRSANIRPD
jgi:tripartite-type tricarboxylate transporter receptor subunit TctC